MFRRFVFYMVFLLVAFVSKAQVVGGSISGTITDATGAVVPGATVTLTWNERTITVPFVTTFGEVADGETLCYRDSDDWVAVAVAGGDAAQLLGLRPGTRMTLTVT